MSDNSEAAVIKELFSDSIRSNRVFLSSSVIVFYDYALTLPTEISEIWNAKFSGAQIIFFMTRYSFIFTTILQYVSRFSSNPTDSLCRGVYYTTIVSVTFSQIGLLGIFTLRTYAIYQKSIPILVMLCLIGISTVVVSVYSDIHLVTPLADPFGFKFPTSCAYATDPRFSRFLSTSQCLIFVFDFAVFSLTFAKTIHHTILMRKFKLGKGLGYVMLRDGIVYFLVQLIIQIAIIIVFNIFKKGVSWDGELSTIGNVVVFSVTCRLVLNLRQVARTPKLQTISSLDAGTIPEEPEFATNSILGNIGATLRIGRDVDDEEDLESPVDDQISLEATDELRFSTNP